MTQSIDARRYFRSADERYQDAEILLQGGRTTGCVYIAGYAVECSLKALLLKSTRGVDQQKVFTSFRGSFGHNLSGLLESYVKAKQGKVPKDVIVAITDIADWTTDLRYDPKIIKDEEAKAFLGSAQNVMNWVKGRL